MDVDIASLGEVAQQSEAGLPDLRHCVLHTLVQQVHDVTAGHQPLYVAVQPLGQPRQEVQGHDHEVLVGRVQLVGVLAVGDGLVESLLHQTDTALVDGLTIREESFLQGRGHTRQTLQQGEQVLVVILQHIPLLYERRHQQVDVLRLVEMMTHTVRQGPDGVIEDQQVLVLIFVEGEHESLQDEAQVGDKLRAGLLLEGSEGGAGGLLDSLVAVQDPLQELRHEGLEVLLVRLLHHPVAIAGEGPAGDAADQRLLVRQAGDEEGDELGEVRDHPAHAALSDGAQGEDAALLHLPLGVEESLLEDGQQDGQQLGEEHVGQNIQRCSRTLSQVPVREGAVIVKTIIVLVVHVSRAGVVAP